MSAADDQAPARRARMPGAERRSAILAAARAEFARHGFHGAGTAAIARAAGCSEAILYRHFASKKALLLAVLREEIGARVGASRALAPPPGADPVAALPAALAGRLAEEEFATTARLVLLAISMTGDPEVGGAVREVFDSVRAPLRAALDAGQAAGAVRDDVDAGLLTWIWHGLFLVAAVRDAVARDGVAAEAVAAAEALARLLRPPAAGA
ncbi:TetR/AcrR family transcriptional regulator [Miltoncostaea marina]|uniref:TetR/AcrR family transcriptional regulator n=1 Tax=Miltoncostaea marina TaxID=2843215 RepID=UPI001C3CDCF0|nr:TetR/AcrR family transcriptional regulator [Miltoncostaea marina]